MGKIFQGVKMMSWRGNGTSQVLIFRGLLRHNEKTYKAKIWRRYVFVCPLLIKKIIILIERDQKSWHVIFKDAIILYFSYVD